MIKTNSKILFQGDSITDAGRNRDIIDAVNNPTELGFGYCNIIASKLLIQNDLDNLKFYNRGISGNRVVDLYARWKIDAVNLEPDIISIMVGINDSWHEFGNQNGVETDRYEKIYTMLLEYTKEKLPDICLILCEPFIINCGVANDAMIQDLKDKQEVVKTLANKFNTIFVPFQSALDNALNNANPESLSEDGVHPTNTGHEILAECWLKTVLQ